MDDRKLFICLEGKHNNNGGQHDKHQYLICSLRFSDLTSKPSDSPTLTKEVLFEAYPSMGCGFYDSNIVFAGGQVKIHEDNSANEELVEESSHNGLITFNMINDKLSYHPFPSMLCGKVKPLVFQLHQKLYVMDTVSVFHQGSFEYFNPKKQEWSLLPLPPYHEDLYELAFPRDCNYPCLVFGNACYLAISVRGETFIYLHHPNITYGTWLPNPCMLPRRRVPFSGVATFCHQDDLDDFLVISFTGRVVKVHHFDSNCILRGSGDLFSLPSSSECAEHEEMSGYFADFGDRIFSLTASDNVCVHVWTFQIHRHDHPEVFQMLSQYKFKLDALSFGVDIISVIGCFAPDPNVEAINHAEEQLVKSFQNFAQRSDDDPDHFVFRDVKFAVPAGRPGNIVSVSLKTPEPVDVFCILSS